MRRRTTVLLGATALLIGAPAGAYLLNPERGNPYADELAEARTSGTAFQREVLYDGTITDGELSDARRLWRACLDENGVSPAQAMEHSGPIATRCYDDTIGELESLHYVMTVDPEKKGFSVVLAECLQRKGLLTDGQDPEDYTIGLVEDAIDELGLDHPGVGGCMENPAAE